MGTCHLFFDLILILISVYIEAAQEETAQVGVRAVLISCEPDVSRSVPYDNEAMRFEREELFKHSVIRDCHRKIALTVKIASDPSSGDEYIPIEHVFQGPKTRVRLLNPYVLRLRREQPLQAYKLNKINTVAAILAEELSIRAKRKLKSDAFTVQDQQESEQYINISRKFTQDSSTCGKFQKRSSNNLCTSRSKRHDNIEGNPKSEGEISLGIAEDGIDSGRLYYDKTRLVALDDYMSERSYDSIDKIQLGDGVTLEDLKPIKKDLIIIKTKKPKPYEVKTKIDLPDLDEPIEHNRLNSKKQNGLNEMVDNKGQEYDVFEISSKAGLWNTIQVQLFEKLTTPEGKTVWNDLTKGDPARVSSISPEWSGQDINVRYRSSEWIPREEYTLPVTNMRLLAPVDSMTSSTMKIVNTAEQYIVVPREDVVSLPIDEKINLYDTPEEATKQNKQSLPRVLIRTSRALIGGCSAKVNIVANEGDQFMTLVHKQPYHAHIELEARADGNQLVHIGSFGRLMTVVADSSRKIRTVLTVQATNTGLAAARFRVVARECQPEVPELLDEKVNGAADNFILLPPKHTQSIRLDVPNEIPVDVAHCTVALINGDDQTVAVRDVTIRKGDRCFCVWHCECVCLGEDPKLLCREMPEVRQIAAGLTVPERTRHVRSACFFYPDVVSVNMLVMAFGVVTTLLFFGFLKACLGLVLSSFGSWGLYRILQMPRKLDRYYESSLRGRKVVYDDQGWPVHPDTHQRTVRSVSMPMEFILNTIFFVTVPSIIIYDALKQIFCRFKNSDKGSSLWNPSKNTKNYFSSQDNIQGTSTNTRSHWRRRRSRLQRWMTPQAETLTSNVLQNGLPIYASVIKDTMQPLLGEEQTRGDAVVKPVLVPELCGDSDVDDTEYVLMQMQKSRESLAKSQRKLNSSVTTETKKQ